MILKIMRVCGVPMKCKVVRLRNDDLRDHEGMWCIIGTKLVC